MNWPILGLCVAYTVATGCIAIAFAHLSRGVTGWPIAASIVGVALVITALFPVYMIGMGKLFGVH